MSHGRPEENMLSCDELRDLPDMLVVPRVNLSDMLKPMSQTMAFSMLLLMGPLLLFCVPLRSILDPILSPCAAADAVVATYMPSALQQYYIGNLKPTACSRSIDQPSLYTNLVDLFYHLGGNGPWIPKRRDISSSDIERPQGCEIEQVHMMSRHAERYPTKNAGGRHLELLQRLSESSSTLHPAFDFLSNWTYFTSWENPAFEQLTSTSQYAGTLEAFNTGVKLRTRYQELIPIDGRSTRLWSASSARDVATARYFADGFFGREWETEGLAELIIIPETADRGGDTLTPGDTCLEYIMDKVEGHDKGYGVLAHWQSIYIQSIIKKLEGGNSSITLTPIDVYSMMEMCGFEMLVRDGVSPWCHLFDHKAWINFEYARDLLHFYRAGPGNRFSKVMGMLWLNATLEILEQGPDAGTLFFSFVHDGDIVPMLSALGYPSGSDGSNMPSDELQLDRAYKTSDIIPMGGRVILERLKCGTAKDQGIFIRMNINDAVVPLSHRQTGPGGSTSLDDLREYLKERAVLAGDFREVCRLNEDAPSRISFLHQRQKKAVH